LYLSNLTPLFGVAIAYPVLWSLAVEQQFYLFWPLIVRSITPGALAVLSVAIILVSPFLRLLSFRYQAPQAWVFYEVFDYTWNSSDGLACGALLAIWLWEFPPSRKRFRNALLALLALTLMLSPLAVKTRGSALGAALQVVPWHFLFFVILGFALLAGSRWGDRMRSRVLEYFGKISYGLYLYQLLVLWAFEGLIKRGIIPRLQVDPFLGLCIRFLICGSVSVLAADLSRRYLEEPFLKWKTRLVS
jgi:peptidoglycan/LPS O-acetylase OafA/YrhL